jgi:lipoprotein-anchoring transpeptidase ErfK/SrfK
MRRQVGRPTARATALTAVTGAVLAGATAFAVARTTAPHHVTDLTPGPRTAQAASRQHPGPAEPLRVLAISPGNSADPVTVGNPVRVTFSEALAPGSPRPAFSPAIKGRWHTINDDTMVFTPRASIRPATQLTLRLPAGSTGLRSVTGAHLATAVTAVFQAGGWSTLRLEELLAQLGYLPLTWTPDSGYPSGPITVSYTGRSSAGVSPGGEFSWQGAYPSALTSLWQPGKPGVILTGALMAFQADHGLPMTGTISRRLFRAVLKAVALGEHNANGYSYALASKTLPETLTVWHNGRIVSHGLANTGATSTPTADGTFPVYLRTKYQIMRGLLPNGKPYADPAHFVSYFKGDYAVHSMHRASFGHPQSLGCVELPYHEAKQVWPYLTYGSLVTVAG